MLILATGCEMFSLNNSTESMSLGIWNRDLIESEVTNLQAKLLPRKYFANEHHEPEGDPKSKVEGSQ